MAQLTRQYWQDCLCCHDKGDSQEATQTALRGEGTEESPLHEIDLGAPSKFTTGQHFLEMLVKVESEGQQHVRP